MQIIEHTVTPNDTLFSLCNEYNVTPEIIVNSNIMKYPRLIDYPFMIFQNWISSFFFLRIRVKKCRKFLVRY